VTGQMWAGLQRTSPTILVDLFKKRANLQYFLIRSRRVSPVGKLGELLSKSMQPPAVLAKDAPRSRVSLRFLGFNVASLRVASGCPPHGNINAETIFSYK